MAEYPADPIEVREHDAVHGHDEREDFERDIGELPTGEEWLKRMHTRCDPTRGIYCPLCKDEKAA